jgi:hypothetical protein
VSRYTILIPAGAPGWAQQLQAAFNSTLTRIEVDMRPKYLALAELPTDGSERLAIVTDEAGGEVLAFLDTAGAWRRCTDRAVVS